MLSLGYSYIFSADVVSYSNNTTLTGDWQLGSEVAEYSCAAVMLLLLATCAARGLRSAEGQKHVQLDGAGGKVKPTNKTADCRENLNTQPSSKKEAPLSDYNENLTTLPPSKKETPVVENIINSSGRSEVDKQHQRQLEIIDQLDRLISFMPDDESDSSSEFVLKKPRCRVYSQDQAFYSWSSSSTESIVSIEEMESRKSAERSPRKGASEGFATLENQGVIIYGDDYSGAIKKRKSDDQLNVVGDSHRKTTYDAPTKSAERSPRKGPSEGLATLDNQDTIIKGAGYSGEIKKRKSDAQQRAIADVSSQAQCEEDDIAALHNVVCDSHRKTTSEAAAQTGTSGQKVSVDVQAQCPESSRHLDGDTMHVFGEVGLERRKKPSESLGSETEESDSEGEWSCFLHNVVPKPKTTRTEKRNISSPKSVQNRSPKPGKEDKKRVTPVTVYSKNKILLSSKKDGTRKSEAQHIKLNKDVSPRNVHYMFSNLEEGAVMPHTRYYEEEKNEMSATTMGSTKEISPTSKNDVSIEMIQRTQKFSDEWVPEPTQWDLLYSFPHPLNNSDTPTANETETRRSKTGSYDDIGSCITGSNSSFEKALEFIHNLKPYDRSSIIVERSQKSTVSQLHYLTGRELESVQLSSAPTVDDVPEGSGRRLSGNECDALPTYLHTTDDDFLRSNLGERCSNTPGGQQIDGQNSPTRQRRENHDTTPARQISSSRAVQTSAERANYSEKSNDNA